MSFLFDPGFWMRWLGIVLIDMTLAGDNALVIALAVRSLPPKDQFWGRVWGTLGAVILRVTFIAIVTQLLAIPFLQLVGGCALIWIAIKLVRSSGDGEGNVRQGTTLRDAIGIIIIADVVMSLDNVIAIAAAAHGDMVLVVFGLLLSLPLVVWGSGVLARLMNRFPWIIWLGGGVLGYVAGEMLFKDPVVARWMAESVGGMAHALARGIAVGLAVFICGLGWWCARRTSRLPDGAEEKS